MEKPHNFKGNLSNEPDFSCHFQSLNKNFLNLKQFDFAPCRTVTRETYLEEKIHSNSWTSDFIFF